MRNIMWIFLLLAAVGCRQECETAKAKNDKVVIYQSFPRIFGNQNINCKPWGTIEENGVGKFTDYTDTVLDSLKSLGITHLWLTGVPHHALQTDYTAYGINNDDADVVKGLAGSPYAVKDYYNVNPDLANDPKNRLAEFESLIKRIHRHGLKVIIDIVPNHVARQYHSMSHPEADFGLNDNTSVEYSRDNNFYYIPQTAFSVPLHADGQLAKGGDGKFDEMPAKWTGDGSRLAQPNENDWYETVKINYGIRPDGTKDFDTIPAQFADKSAAEHFDFWKDKSVPNSWIKFRDIALFWLSKGVDGFRYDMAEMVPVEFWSYMNSSIKNKNAKAFLMAEIYNPAAYDSYLNIGKMDYLYDKVQLYDTLRAVTVGTTSATAIAKTISAENKFASQLIHFMENHDEQRLASDEFAKSTEKGMPSMVVSTLASNSPIMIYYGQEVGESAKDDAGFGKATRTTIFDYYSIKSLQRWFNNGKCDGEFLTEDEKNTRDFYQRLMNIATTEPAIMGDYTSLKINNADTSKVFAFARSYNENMLIVATNFSDSLVQTMDIEIPKSIVENGLLTNGNYKLKELLYAKNKATLNINDSNATIKLTLKPLKSAILAVR